MAEKPINENQVVDAICAFLRKKGYEITQSRHTHQRGIDVVAQRKRGKQTILVEAKGDTSSWESSSRSGLPFDSSQVKSHTGVALLKAMTLHEAASDPKTRVSIAIPRSDRQNQVFKGIRRSLKRLGITLLWVDPRTKKVYAEPAL